MSRSSLAEATGLSRSAITEVTQGLIDLGLLEELPVSYAEQRRGRPSVLLSFASSHGYFLGVSITDRPSAIVLVNLRGEIVGECEIPFQPMPADVAASIRKGLTQLLKMTRVPRERVFGVGIAVTGIVEQETGDCRYSAALNWRDVPIGNMVEKATGVKTYIDNDANMIAIGQKLFGRGRDLKHYSSLILGRNIGCAHFIDNKLYRGHDGSAGEIGHITVDPAGPLCRCGRNGCLDMYAGGAALENSAKALGIETASMRELEVLAASGSSDAYNLLRRGGQALGLTVASLVQINNPETVLFADLEGFGNGLFSTTTRQTIENNILPRFLSTTQIVFQPMDQSFLARGAASMAVQKFLHASG
ncbi:ROK family protein [Granulicella pectinivorans]|nr:ROK family protein [Granulicella pectinivorans]